MLILQFSMKDLMDDKQEFFLPTGLILDDSTEFGQEKKNKPKNLQELLDTPCFYEKINVPAKASPMELLFMILKLAVGDKFPLERVSKVMSLINAIFEKPVLPMESSYMIDKFFNEKNNSELHITCSKCKHYVGVLTEIDDNHACPKCGENAKANPSSDNLIVILDPSNTIVSLIESNADYYDNVVSRNYEESISSIRDVYDGRMYREFVSSLPAEEKTNFVTGVINSDGAQPFEKSPTSLWPIYIMLNELPVKERFKTIIPCAMWFNRKKPNFSIFLSLFIDLVKKIQSRPLECTIKGEKRLIRLYILMCCVDSVARAYMQGITQFNGKFGCSWCLHPTESYNRVTKYPIDLYNKRPRPAQRTKEKTVETMMKLSRSKPKIDGIKAISPLIFLEKFNIIDGVTPDYMHCVLLGVVKQITNILMQPADVPDYQDQLNSIKLPHQVCRLTRPIEDNAYWNARIWENWLLYVSMKLFSTKLSTKYLKYWSLLVESIHILLKSEILNIELDRSERMLKLFVELTQRYFGKAAMTFNVHQLLHLVDSVRNWGPLWAHSAFAFEAGNHRLLQAIHCANGAILQILRFININNSVSVIEKRLFSDESEIARTFCTNTITRRAKSCYKIGNRTYFGVEKKVDPNLRDYLELSNESFSYDRMVHTGCLFVTCLKNNKRSDNSVAKLYDESYVRIETFIVDKLIKKEIIKCKRLDICPEDKFYNCKTIKTVLRHTENESGNNVLFIETNQIKSICVHYVSGETEIVCCVPNLLYY